MSNSNSSSSDDSEPAQPSGENQQRYADRAAHWRSQFRAIKKFLGDPKRYQRAAEIGDEA